MTKVSELKPPPGKPGRLGNSDPAEFLQWGTLWRSHPLKASKTSVYFKRFSCLAVRVAKKNRFCFLVAWCSGGNDGNEQVS